MGFNGSGGLGNATSLGSQGRTGAAILTSSRANRGSMGRVYSYFSNFSQSKKELFYKNQAVFLYGVNGSAYNRGIA